MRAVCRLSAPQVPQRDWELELVEMFPPLVYTVGIL